jgi:hypothetical protein
MGNTRAPSTYCGSAANSGATSYNRAAAVNSGTSRVGSSTAILIIRITIATSVVTAAHNCCASNNRPPSNGRSTAINGTTANCGASVDAAASGGSSLCLQSLAIYRDSVWKY